MKIAVFTDVLLDVPGGIPSSIFAQKKSLEALGHEVIVFAPGFYKHKGRLVFKGHDSLANFSSLERKTIKIVPTHRLIKPNGAPLSMRPTLVEKFVLTQFPDFDFDIVHVHYEASCSIAGMRLARRFGRRLVQTMHGREDMAVQINIPFGLKTITAALLNFLHSRYIPHTTIVHRDSKLAPTLARVKMWTLMVNHANYADTVITPSKHFADKLKKCGVNREINVVSNGVDDKLVATINEKAKKIYPSRSVFDALTKKIEEGDVLRIFWNSRLSNEKRIIPFLEALHLMKKPFFATFCGDGNALKKAKRFVQKNNLAKKVRFYGRVPHAEVLDKMQGQHIAVTVSYGFDTQGLTLLEAEAAGLPVLFCDPDMRESVPGGGGILTQGPEPIYIARALDSVAQNPETIEQMSRMMLESRQDILQSTQIAKLLKVYKAN